MKSKTEAVEWRASATTFTATTLIGGRLGGGDGRGSILLIPLSLNPILKGALLGEFLPHHEHPIRFAVLTVGSKENATNLHHQERTCVSF